MKSYFFLTLLLALWPTASLASSVTLPQDSHSAVILAYHRVGEDTFPDSNVTTAQFARHVEILVSGGYNVAPLADVVSALEQGKSLPPHTVVITFDGGYKSVVTNALPLLSRHELPFTVFFSVDYADQKKPEHLDWSDLSSISDGGGTIGIHPASYTRLSNKPAEEVARQINKAKARYREEMEAEPAFFAYPFGEFGKAYRDYVQDQGFTAAFGQQSGALWDGSDIYALPRFPMSEAFANDERFTMTINSLPLPVRDIQPTDLLLGSDETLFIGFTPDPALASQISSLSCYVSGQSEQPEILTLGQNRVELRLTAPLQDHKTRVNCTIPGPDDESDGIDAPRWRWFGLLLTRENAAEAEH